MASPEYYALQQRFAAVRRGMDAVPTLAEQRAISEGFADNALEPEGVAYEHGDADGVRVLVVTPEGADERRVVQYLHGGGYQVCSIESHRKLVGHIAKAAGAVAISVDYRMTPEHRHPAPVDDSLTVYRWLLARGFSGDEIVVAGDSAGGGLALATVLALKGASMPLPAAVVAISPWTDMTLSSGSMTSSAGTDITVTTAYLGQLRDDLVSEDRRTDPLVSPLFGDLSGFPPVYLQAGDGEILRDDAVNFGAKASAAGVQVTFDIVPEMQHVFIKAVGNMPEADEGIDRLGTFLRGVFTARSTAQPASSTQ